MVDKVVEFVEYNWYRSLVQCEARGKGEVDGRVPLTFKLDASFVNA